MLFNKPKFLNVKSCKIRYFITIMGFVKTENFPIFLVADYHPTITVILHVHINVLRDLSRKCYLTSFLNVKSCKIRYIIWGFVNTDNFPIFLVADYQRTCISGRNKNLILLVVDGVASLCLWYIHRPCIHVYYSVYIVCILVFGLHATLGCRNSRWKLYRVYLWFNFFMTIILTFGCLVWKFQNRV